MLSKRRQRLLNPPVARRFQLWRGLLFILKKPAARRKRLQALAGESRTLIFYKAARRFSLAAADLAKAYARSLAKSTSPVCARPC